MSVVQIGLKRALLSLIATAIYFFCDDAQAQQYQFCVHFNVSMENSDFGEDFYQENGPYPARHFKMKVSRGGVTLLATTYANEWGCVVFNDTTLGQFKLEVWGEALIPSTNDPTKKNYLKAETSTGAVPYYTALYTFVAAPYSAVIFLPYGNVSNLLSIGGFGMQRYSDGLSGKTTVLRDHECSVAGAYSCNEISYVSQTAIVSIHPDHNQRKFAIGHELGHAFLAHWFNQQLYFSGQYDINAGSPACEWAGAGDHAIHSKEYSSGAFFEGYCHYYATQIFNDVNDPNGYGAFWYYKDGVNVGNIDMEAGPDGGMVAYMDHTCTGPLAGRGVELDWARMLWDFRTDGGTKPSNFEMTRLLKSALNVPGWHRDTVVDVILDGFSAYDTVNGTSYYPRWTAIHDINGVNHPLVP